MTKSAVAHSGNSSQIEITLKFHSTGVVCGLASHKMSVIWLTCGPSASIGMSVVFVVDVVPLCGAIVRQGFSIVSEPKGLF